MSRRRVARAVNDPVDALARADPFTASDAVACVLSLVSQAGWSSGASRVSAAFSLRSRRSWRATNQSNFGISSDTIGGWR